MRVSVTDAREQLTDVVRRAQAGAESILTRHAHAPIRLVPLKRAPDAKARRALLEAARTSAAAKVAAGPNAARSQHFLYDEDGLPK